MKSNKIVFVQLDLRKARWEIRELAARTNEGQSKCLAWGRVDVCSESLLLRRILLRLSTGLQCVQFATGDVFTDAAKRLKRAHLQSTA